MSDATELFDALGQTVDANTSEEGIDVVNIIMTLVEAMKEIPNMTVEDWEVFRTSINNMSTIINNEVDKEIAQLNQQGDK